MMTSDEEPCRVRNTRHPTKLPPTQASIARASPSALMNGIHTLNGLPPARRLGPVLRLQRGICQLRS